MLMIDQKKNGLFLNWEKKIDSTIDFSIFSWMGMPKLKKLIAKISLITRNAWIEISQTTSFDAKCGVEDLALLSVYPRPFGCLDPV